MSAPREPSGERRSNRLAHTSSPYLLQHQFNPVNWFPWGDQAFAEARTRDVPILLSVGYSTCYWCHVMERESFEDDAIAAHMNRDFVCVKVDREERPDVDDIYMAAVQAFSGRGGWPMSVFLEPRTLKPFWAGTYFPAKARFPNIPTFPEVLSAIAEAWRNRREEVLSQAHELAEAVRERVQHSAAPVKLGEQTLSDAVSQLLNMFDRASGGFGPAPKFPQPVFLELLLEVRRVADSDTRSAIDVATRRTLDAMAMGGIFDQVGGGFHRYSVDELWRVPHFEKMLYDNGQLLGVYAQAAAEYADPLYARTAARILEYALRELRSPDGAFFAAQDAEVNHREGQNYLWTREQIASALPAADAEFASNIYGILQGPNFRDPHHPGDAPANVLFLRARPAELATELRMDEPALLARIDAVNRALLEVRATRDQPLLDTKVLAGWNGLMIAGFAAAARHAIDPRALPAAKQAADFVLTRMRTSDGELLRSFAARPGEAPLAHTPAFLEDYALFVHGLLTLVEACRRLNDKSSDHYLQAAKSAFEIAERLFRSPDSGYFDTRESQRDVFVRAQSIHDGAIPSASAIMIQSAIELSRLTGDNGYADRAARALRSMSGAIAAAPLGAAASVRALLKMLMSYRGQLDRAFEGVQPETLPQVGTNTDSPVEIFAEGDDIQLSAGEAATILLRIKVAPGYHITAADPGSTPAARALVPLRVHTVSGTGVSVYADYPEGEQLGDGDQAVRVYTGEIDLQVVLERAGQWSGEPLLAVTYQACTDRACLEPTTVELDVTIERA